jgi:hypothetical protein
MVAESCGQLMANTSPAPLLTFNEERHEYHHNGVPVPNVTRILSPLMDYSMVPADKLEIARQKGTHVHRMVELWATGDLVEETLPDWMKPVFAQWLKFVADTGFELFASENRVFHNTYRYAGTLDLYGKMHRNKYPCYIDIKRSFLAGPSIGLQLAAYQEAHGDKLAARFALKLNENGPYRLESFEDKADFGVFLSLLTIHNWKGKHQ